MSLILTDIPYESHPSFSGVSFNEDKTTLSLALALQTAVEDCRRKAHISSYDIDFIIKKNVYPALEALKRHMLLEAGVGSLQGKFIDAFFGKLLKLLIEDLLLTARRGTHAKVDGGPNVATVFNALVDNGFILLRYPQEAVNHLHELMKPFKELLWSRYQNGERIRENLQINSWHPSINNALRQIFNEPTVVTALENYMGLKVGYTGVSFELSTPDEDWWRGRHPGHESPETVYMHLDQSSALPKMLLYLSDVTPENGATTVLNVPLGGPLLGQAAGRAMDTTFILDDNHKTPDHLLKYDWGRRFFAALPKPLRAVGHFGHDLLPGSPWEDMIVKNRIIMTGPPGTCAVFDGARVVHRGSNCVAGIRWAFQVIYGPV